MQHAGLIFSNHSQQRWQNRHNNFTIIENKMMDNCTLVNKLFWHESEPWHVDTLAVWNLFVKNCYCMFLAFWNKLRQKLSLPIFFIDGKYWVWCYPNLCNIRRCYPNILSVCPAHPGQGIPTELSSSLTRECHIVSVVTRGRWGHNAGVRCGPQIIYICAIISAQLSSSSAYMSLSLKFSPWELRDQDNVDSKY